MKMIQRLLGVLAVIALLSAGIAIVFYYIQSPQKPYTETAPNIEFDVTERADIKTDAQNNAIDLINNTLENPVEPIVEKTDTQKEWAVQVGIFNQTENATRLVKKLQSQGFQVTSRQIFVKKELMTQVLVGPEITQEAAKTLQLRLEKAVHIKGRILSPETDNNVKISP